MSAQHVVVFTRVSLPGLPEVGMHVVYSCEEGRALEPFVPGIHYVLEMDRVGRPVWQREVLGVVAMLLDYVDAHGRANEPISSDVLRGFTQALLSGTRHLDTAERRGLWWGSRSRDRTSTCLSKATAFLDWLADHTGQPSANPWRAASATERLAQLRRLDRRAAHSLLDHVVSRQRLEASAGRVREVRLRRSSKNAPFNAALAFDDKAFKRLLTKGFARPAPPGAPPADRLLLRNVLITILLHAGGLRLSEPFHLFLGDVREDPLRPGSALVRLFHPEDGQAPEEDGRTWPDRTSYLRERWQRPPRTMERGRFQAGWKNLALEDGTAKCAFVHWFHPWWGQEFLRLFRCYLAHRPRGNHPYLFVSEHPEHRGEPYTPASFRQAHARAVSRIGLEPSKGGGTSPHGHRHAYGKRMNRAGLKPLFIQRAMHHCSSESQLVYTAASTAELTAALRDADARMNAGTTRNLIGGES